MSDAQQILQAIDLAPVESVSRFDSAEFFSVSNDAAVYSKTPEDAIVEYFEDSAIGPVTIFAYVLDAIPADWTRRLASNVVESIRQNFRDDFGGPDGELALETFPERMSQKCAEWLVQVCCPAQSVSRCAKIAERYYSAAEVYDIMKARTK